MPLPSSPLLQPFTRSFSEVAASFPQGTEPIQDEELYPAQNGPYVQDSVMEEEDDERDGDSTSPSSPPKIDKTRANRQREPKVLAGKQFPVKLFKLLEGEAATNFISWRESGSSDAICIPDTKAFEANVMPTYFKEMKQWGSFQKQLNNYGFEKKDRGTGKAVYAHPKFRKGRPDLLSQVLRKQNCRTKAIIGRDLGPAGERAPSPVAPATPQSASHINPLVNENQLEHENKQLKPEILEFYKREFEARLLALEDQGTAAADRHKATEDRLKAAEDKLKATEGQGNTAVDRLKVTEDRLKATEDRLKAAEDRLKAAEDRLKAAGDRLHATDYLLQPMPDLYVEPSRNLGAMSMADGGSNSSVHLTSSDFEFDIGSLLNTHATSTGAVEGFPALRDPS